MKTPEETTALPEKLRLVRTHPDEKTRRQLLELVTHDHGQFGSEEALFFCAEDGSARALLAQACVDRYNSHAADKAKIKALVEALERLLAPNGMSNTVAHIYQSLADRDQDTIDEYEADFMQAVEQARAALATATA